MNISSVNISKLSIGYIVKNIFINNELLYKIMWIRHIKVINNYEIMFQAIEPSSKIIGNPFTLFYEPHINFDVIDFYTFVFEDSSEGPLYD
jgi:hypothetical protein